MNIFKYLIAVVVLMLGFKTVLSSIGASFETYEPEYSDQSGEAVAGETSASLVTSPEPERSVSAPASSVSTASVENEVLNEDAKRTLHQHAMLLKYMTAPVVLKLMKGKIDIACANSDKKTIKKPDIGDVATPNIAAGNNDICMQEKSLQQDAILDVLRDPKNIVDPADRDMLMKYLMETLV